MQLFKILTRTFLILSITNVALAAPVAVRERPDVRLDADVTRNVGAVLRKRWDPYDNWGSPLPSVPGLDHWNSPPPSPDLTNALAEIATTNRLPPTPDSPESFAGYMPNLEHTPLQSPESFAGYMPNLEHTPLQSPESFAGYMPNSEYTPPQSPEPFAGYVPPNLDHTPPQSPELAEVLSQVAHTDKTPTLDSAESFPPGYPPPNLDHAPPQSPDLTEISESDYNHYMSPPVPSPSRTPPGPTQIWSQPAEQVKQLDIPPPSQKSTPVAGPLWAPPPPPPHPSQPGPSEDRFQGPLAGLLTSNQPKPPQRLVANPEVHTIFSSDFPTIFWKEFMKNKIKPRMSRSDAVDLAQKEPRF